MKHKLLIVLACLLSLAIFLPACGVDLEREEIIEFTNEALEIEAKRSELMAYFADLPEEYPQTSAIEKYFSSGVPASGLEGMASLRRKLSLLSSPQSLQFVKDALLEAYDSEIKLSQLQAKRISERIQGITEWGNYGVIEIIEIFPAVTKDNLDYWRQALPEVIKKWAEVRPSLNTTMLRGLDRLWYGGGNLMSHEEKLLREVHKYHSFGQDNFNIWVKQTLRQAFENAFSGDVNYDDYIDVISIIKSDWFTLQEFRLEVYTRWAEILQEHGIDPAQEGFTELMELE